MWIVAIAWMYVAVMMAVAEATSPQGSMLGAVITLLFYGLAPVALVMYLLSTPARRRAIRAAEARQDAALAAQTSEAPDGQANAQTHVDGSQAPTAPEQPSQPR